MARNLSKHIITMEEYLIDSELGSESIVYSTGSYILYILLALLPAIILMAFILWRDKVRPEPAKELILAFLMGLLTLPMAIFLETSAAKLGLVPSSLDNWRDCLGMAFVGAAIPEELVKIIILWAFFKWRKHQNEFMDGIVYAVCIGLAFAAAENIRYVLAAMDLIPMYTTEYVYATGVVRALTAVPGHFGFAVIMGYFYSFYLFSKYRKTMYLALAFIVPVLFHGLYDFFAFMQYLPTMWQTVISFAFFLVFFLLNNLCVKAIRTALKLDDAVNY